MLSTEIKQNMQDIVDNCMGSEVPGCQATCPMHTDVKEYIRLIREDQGPEAIKVIRDKLFLPGTLGRICAHPCEKECKWKEANSPLGIANLKRYAADNFDRVEDWDLSIAEENHKKVAVIGAGPSGMQAAIDLRKEGCEVTVYDKLPVRGGMMAVGIPEYRLPRDVLENEISYLDKLGIKFELNCEIGKDIAFDTIEAENDAVVVAVGKHKGRVDMSLNNATAEGIYNAADYLREAALTRAHSTVGKKVLVVGGGDVAMDCCRVSLRLEGVEEVQSICLEDSFDSMASSNHEIKGALEEGVNFNHAAAIKDIIVDENNRVSKVVLKKCLSMFDEEGRFSPSFDDNETKEVEVDSIVFAIGQMVDVNFPSLEQRRNTTFECDPFTLQSNTNEKVFFAGDASGESVIVIQAMATGRRAAESVKRMFKNESLTENREIEDTKSYHTKLFLEVDWTDIKERRLEMRDTPVVSREKNFEEVSLGYSKAEAIEEANRCRQCECKLCMKECIMLNEYTDCPKTLFKEYLEKGYEKMDKMIAYSCNECRQCTIKCPKDFPIRDNFMAIKEELAKDNKGLAQDEGLVAADKTQALECNPKYCVSVPAPKKKKTKYVFIPGCTVPAYTPNGVEETLKHLKDALGEENVGAILRCCGRVTEMMGETDRFKVRNKMVIDEIEAMGAEIIVTICPSCYKVYSETATNQKVISYWDLMKEEIGLPEVAKNVGRDSDVTFNVHDPCVTRNVISHHESVRWMLEEMGYNMEEMDNHGKNTRCCGVGGMVCSSRPDLYEKIYTRRGNDCTQDNVVTYCGSCRGSMQASGKDSLHILDLMFGKTYTKDQATERGYKSPEEMWANRLETKHRFEKYLPESK